MTGDTQVSSYDLDEVRIALGGPDGGHVADKPKEEARDPRRRPMPSAARTFNDNPLAVVMMRTAA